MEQMHVSYLKAFDGGANQGKRSVSVHYKVFFFSPREEQLFKDLSSLRIYGDGSERN